MDSFYEPPNTVYFITVIKDGSKFPVSFKPEDDRSFFLRTGVFTAFDTKDAANEALATLRAKNPFDVFLLERRVARQKKK